MANQMLSHMQDLQRIYDAVSDRILLDLCRRFPGFERYARLMEGISEQSQTMAAAGTPSLRRPAGAARAAEGEPDPPDAWRRRAGARVPDRRGRRSGRASRAAHHDEEAMGRRPPEARWRVPLIGCPSAHPGAGATGGQGHGRADRADGTRIATGTRPIGTRACNGFSKLISAMLSQSRGYGNSFARETSPIDRPNARPRENSRKPRLSRTASRRLHSPILLARIASTFP